MMVLRLTPVETVGTMQAWVPMWAWRVPPYVIGSLGYPTYLHVLSGRG